MDQQRQIIIQGGSAGGLLMGAVVNMRPDFIQSRARSRAVCRCHEHHDGCQLLP